MGILTDLAELNINQSIEINRRLSLMIIEDKERFKKNKELSITSSEAYRIDANDHLAKIHLEFIKSKFNL